MKSEQHKHKHFCRLCGDDSELTQKRWVKGHKFCINCGDEIAKQRKFCVAPMHKSNYMLITDRADLHGLNNKGGLVK